MNYNYTNLYSLFSLQQKEIKDVMLEAQKALETLENNRKLLERHFQLTLHLQEITRSLELLQNRAEEVKEYQRSLRLHMLNDNQSQVDQPINNKLNNNNVFDKTATSESPKADTFTTSSDTPSVTHLVQPNQQTKFHNQLEFMQLEVMELNNQQEKLNHQRKAFESELISIENQLTSRGIGATQ